MQYRVLYDYAINTGDFYPAHCAMARDGAGTMTWTKYVKHTILRRYRTDCHEPYEGMSKDEIALVARELRDYYRNHIREMD